MLTLTHVDTDAIQYLINMNALLPIVNLRHMVLSMMILF